MARTGLRGSILSIWVEGGARWHPRALDNFARPSASLGNVTWPVFWVKPAGEGYASRGECNSLLRGTGTQDPARRLGVPCLCQGLYRIEHARAWRRCRGLRMRATSRTSLPSSAASCAVTSSPVGAAMASKHWFQRPPAQVRLGGLGGSWANAATGVGERACR